MSHTKSNNAKKTDGMSKRMLSKEISRVHDALIIALSREAALCSDNNILRTKLESKELSITRSVTQVKTYEELLVKYYKEIADLKAEIKIMGAMTNGYAKPSFIGDVSTSRFRV
jgi:hypothetical protein